MRAGDRGAFRQLVDRHKDVSLSLAFSILKDRDGAEEVLQEVFLRVFEKLGSFRFRSSFRTWLYRIVVNTSYNALKTRKKYLPLEDFCLHTPVGARPADGPQSLQEEEQKKYITEAMKRLKPDEALVLRLFYLCDMRIKEIKKITGFGTAKIKVDLHRGRTNLQHQLKMMLGDELKNLL
ncbi:RNA polymerase sigma factor [Flavilitoribacter nigricans]|uniref:RNA polymerase sigma factor n=1 Tax=Flavilitoribacter nigricans TaxID=70997 RepID=UPI0037424CEE